MLEHSISNKYIKSRSCSHLGLTIRKQHNPSNSLIICLDVQYQAKEFDDKYKVLKSANNIHVYEIFHVHNEEVRRSWNLFKMRVS